MTDWFLQHTTPLQIWRRDIAHRVEDNNHIFTIPVEWVVEVMPLSEVLAIYKPKTKGRWHLCQARKRLPLAERPAKKNSMWRKFRHSVSRTLPEMPTIVEEDK